MSRKHSQSHPPTSTPPPTVAHIPLTLITDCVCRTEPPATGEQTLQWSRCLCQHTLEQPWLTRRSQWQEVFQVPQATKRLRQGRSWVLSQQQEDQCGWRLASERHRKGWGQERSPEPDHVSLMSLNKESNFVFLCVEDNSRMTGFNQGNDTNWLTFLVDHSSSTN